MVCRNAEPTPTECIVFHRAPVLAHTACLSTVHAVQWTVHINFVLFRFRMRGAKSNQSTFRRAIKTCLRIDRGVVICWLSAGYLLVVLVVSRCLPGPRTIIGQDYGHLILHDCSALSTDPFPCFGGSWIQNQQRIITMSRKRSTCICYT